MSPLINASDALAMGNSRISKIYKGTNRIWPITIPGLCMWLDASALALGQAQHWVNNIEGSGHHMISNELVAYPTVVNAGVRGMPVMRYTAGQAGHRTANLGDTLGSPVDTVFTIAYVGRMRGGTTRRVLSSWFHASFGSPNALVGWWGGYMNSLYLGAWSNIAYGHPDDTTWKVWTCISNGVNADMWTWYPGGGYYVCTVNPVGEGIYGNGGFRNTLYLSPSGDSGLDESSDVDVGEICVWNRPLDATEHGIVINYLRSKWM